jgi:hypothetical protein
MDPSTWEAAAMVMGNSVRQWQASYNSTFRRRAVAGAVVAHPTFISNMAKRDRQRGGGGGALEGEDEAIEEGVEGEGVEEEIEELGRRREPIQINSQPGRRRKKQKALVVAGSGHTHVAPRDGGNFLDPKKQEMRWGAIGGGW